MPTEGCALPSSSDSGLPVGTTGETVGLDGTPYVCSSSQGALCSKYPGSLDQ